MIRTSRGQHFILFFMFYFSLFLSSSVWAQITRINNGNNQDIDAHSVCQNVDNATGLDLMVPTGIAAEWLAFRTNPPTGVTLSACSGCASGSQSFTSNGTFTVPSGYTSLTISGWGGGDGGGNGAKGTSGGAGGKVTRVLSGVAEGAQFSYTIGLAGCHTTGSAGSGAYSGGAGGNATDGSPGTGGGSGGNGGTKIGDGGVGGD